MASKKPTATKTVKVGRPKNGTQFTQSELLEQLAQACDLGNRRVARDVYTGFASLLQAALKKGYKVPLPGIGKIQVRESKARWGRNPATGEQIFIKPKKRVRLTPSKALKEAVL